MGRRYLVAGNWKMYGSLTVAQSLVAGLVTGVDGVLGRVDVAVCPPFVYLDRFAPTLREAGLALGAQDTCEHAGEGAYTGEISAAMLNDVGCRYVIVGHSERRRLFDDTQQRVAAKVAAAQEAGLVPILCVGETLDEREAMRTETVLEAQLDAVLDGCGVEVFRRLVLAYEPVWAIGTGRSATPEQVEAIHAFLRAHIGARDAIIAADLQILYGGSVKPGNAFELFSCANVDGGLIGGASLDAGQFLAICRAAAELAA